MGMKAGISLRKIVFCKQKEVQYCVKYNSPYRKSYYEQQMQHDKELPKILLWLNGGLGPGAG